MKGTVTEFDEHRGLGTVAGEDGVQYGFHCTQIADGTRIIDAGADVVFEVAAGRLGRWEATRVARAPSGPARRPAESA